MRVAFLLLFCLVAASCTGGADGYHSAGFKIAGMSCEHGDWPAFHTHAHLSVFAEGQSVPVPEYAGLDGNCLLPLHTYDATGVIHVETGAERDLTLGAFFAIWHQPLSAGAVLEFKADSTHQIRAFVNGHVFEGDPATIPLASHADIVVDYGPPFPVPEPYEFRASEP